MSVRHVAASFTLDQLFAHLRAEDEPREGFYTTKEWARHFKVTQAKMNDLLVEAKEQDSLEITREMRERLDGVITKVPAYRFTMETDE